MFPTRELTLQKFHEYNDLVFNGQLPEIPIRMSCAKGFLGKLVYSRKRTLSGSVKACDFILRINTRYDMSQQEFEDTVIHEMIHYYIAWKGIKDTSAHGKVFRQMMAEINSRYHRNVNISHRKGDSTIVDSKADERKWHVVAVVDFVDGRRGFKVLPKVKQSIAWYRLNVLRSPEVKTVEVVWSRHPLFNHFPVSKSLRVHFVEKDKLDQALEMKG